MTKDEALDLALEALEYIENNYMSLPKSGNEAITAIKQARSDHTEDNLEMVVVPVQEPEYWNVIDPAGNIVASETNAIRGWARIAGSYKPTVEGLLGFHDQGWRVLPKVAPPVAWNAGVPPLYPEMKDGETISVEYTTPTAAPAQEGMVFDASAPLVMTPHPAFAKQPTAQRQWVDLSDEEINSVRYKRDWTAPWTDTTFARAIEAKLKSKNSL